MPLENEIFPKACHVIILVAKPWALRFETGNLKAASERPVWGPGPFRSQPGDRLAAVGTDTSHGGPLRAQWVLAWTRAALDRAGLFASHN